MAKDEALLRKYLLGDASEEEHKEIEHWLMSEEEAYDLLEAAEDDLIDDSLAGKLKGRALDRFNNHFLAAPERQRKLQFSRSFKRVIKATPPLPVQQLPPDPSFWQRLLDAVRYRPAFAYVGSALIIVMLVGNASSLLRVAELQQELRSATEQLAEAGRDRDGLKRQLDLSQAATQALETQLRQAPAATAKVQSAPLQLALTLMPGALRSSVTVPGNAPTLQQVRLTPDSSLVQFSLALLNDSFTAYRVSLVNGERREILSYNSLAESTTAQGKVVVVAVPAEFLSPGDYNMILSGITDTGALETIDRYGFRTVRQ